MKVEVRVESRTMWTSPALWTFGWYSGHQHGERGRAGRREGDGVRGVIVREVGPGGGWTAAVMDGNRPLVGWVRVRAWAAGRSAARMICGGRGVARGSVA
jgi:hypothetical protein